MTLVIGDLHLKDIGFKNSNLDIFHTQMFQATFSKINDLIIENKVTKLILAGDVFDRVPIQAGAMSLFHQFLHELPEQVSEKIIISGNHELFHNTLKKAYFIDSIKDMLWSKYELKVYDYSELDKNLYCSHQHISKLEKLTKNYDIVFSHFRSGINDIAVDEIDVTLLCHKAKLVIAGDIHYRLQYNDNIIYTGSPIDTHFSSNEEESHKPSVLLLDESTLKWEWLDTLTTSFRKKKVVFPNVKAFQEGVEELRQDALTNNNFYKIVIQDKKHNLKLINTGNYSEFAIFEFIRVDLETDKANREVVSKITETLSSPNISENCLDFILTNNDRVDLVDTLKGLYATYEGKVMKERGVE